MSEVHTIEEIHDLAINKLLDGADIQDIEKDYPEYAEELRPLLEKAFLLQQAPEPDLKPSVQSLMEIVAKISSEEKQLILRFTPRRFFLRIAASIAIIFAIGWGTVYASSETVPGDWFYSIKLFTEKVRFLLCVNDENKVELRIRYSTERLKELVKKYNSGDGLDKELLQIMLDEAKAALDDGQKLKTTIKPLFMERINNLSHLQGKTLKKWKKQVGAADKKILNKSINICMKRCRKICGKMPMKRSCPMMSWE